MRGGCGSAVSGRGRRARMCGIGPVEAVLHIRLGPAGDGSAESCGNSPALNAVEILPCAERVPLHMGARPLKTSILGKPRNHAENSKSTLGGDPLQCATPPHGPGRAPRRRPRSPQMKPALPQSVREGPGSPGSGPSPRPRREPGPARTRPATAGDRPHRTGPGHCRRSRRERLNEPIQSATTVR